MYNSAATYMRSAIVQKLTGEKIVDYLQPRLFAPLGHRGRDLGNMPARHQYRRLGAEHSDRGARQIWPALPAKGQWQGRQSCPRSWVEEATTFKIQQPAVAKPTRPMRRTTGSKVTRISSGAGNTALSRRRRLWAIHDRPAGAGCGDRDDGRNEQHAGQLDLVWEHLLPAMHARGAARTDAAAEEKLRHTLASLALLPPKGQRTSSPRGAQVTGGLPAR